LSNILILVFALIIMTNLGSIQTAWFISLLFGAGMGSVLVLRWLWERINLWSELTAMAASLITAPLLLLSLGTDPDTEWVRLGVMALVTTATAIGITYVTPRTNPQVLLAFYERVQPFGFWSNTARLAGDRPRAPIAALWRRLRALLVTALSLFLLLLGIGRLMISPPDTSLIWTWAYILAGLALIPLWWREVIEEDLDIDRSVAAGDVQVTDSILLADKEGLLLALRKFAQHMKLVYGTQVEVEPYGHHQVEEEGQRVLLFQVVRDLLLDIARRSKRARIRVVLTREARQHVIRLEPEEGIDFAALPFEKVPGKHAPIYDVFAHIRERLYQIEGHLWIEPDLRHAKRITMTSAIETI
jgi:hypothetical protein